VRLPPYKKVGRDLSARVSGSPKLRALSKYALGTAAKLGDATRWRAYIDRRLKPLVTRIKRNDESRAPATTTFPYKEYTITVGAARDQTTGNYRPFIQIVWDHEDGGPGLRSFTLSEQCFTADEARLIAFHEARMWADRWLVGPKG
jgi:hypothetical protein